MRRTYLSSVCICIIEAAAAEFVDVGLEAFNMFPIEISLPGTGAVHVPGFHVFRPDVSLKERDDIV